MGSCAKPSTSGSCCRARGCDKPLGTQRPTSSRGPRTLRKHDGPRRAPPSPRFSNKPGYVVD
eukprot:9011844-Pyramimonas_sp.AAC.2